MISLIYDLTKTYRIYSKIENTKVKYLHCRIMMPLWLILYMGSIFILDIMHSIKLIPFYIEIYGQSKVKGMFYSSILDFSIVIVCFFIFILIFNAVNSIVLVNNDFVVFYNRRINFDEINYVEIHRSKGVFGRKVEISVNGKIEPPFSISSKHVDALVNIFQGKCRIIV